MASPITDQKKGKVEIENIGGIEETTVEFSAGTTAFVGRNATNRSSFLQAVMAGLGSDNVAMKGDADEASVSLTIGDTTYTRKFKRRGGSVVEEGEPYLDDPTLADLFAFLMESNETRQAVGANADLRELIMRPVDTDKIEQRIEELIQERESLKKELDEIDEVKGKLPGLEEQRRELEEKIETKKATLADKNRELETQDGSLEQQKEKKSKLETRLKELSSKRSEIERVRNELEIEREGLEALREEKNELERELSELPESPVGEISQLNSEIDRLREQKRTVETELNQLQNVISFNEEMVKKANSEAFEPESGSSADDITGQLLSGETTQCWTCGSEIEKAQIESTIDRLRETNRSKLAETEELESQIGDLIEKKQTLEQSQRERNEIESRLTSIDAEIEQSERSVDSLQSKRNQLTTDIEEIESKVDELEEQNDSAVLQLHREANQLEYELGKLENDLERVESNITELEDRIAEEDDIAAQLDSINEEITDFRTKIDRLESNAVDKFNEHMETVLEKLDYDNLERIWIERIEQEVREGRQKVRKNTFELHVIRTSDSGAAYEDTIDHLSESEREVTGLVFALAGYLVHELYEDVPFMLLDSLEAIDSERIAGLVEYLTEYTEYLFVALLPEDANALPSKYDRVIDI